MLRWILALSVLCFVSTATALGYVIPLTSEMQNALFTFTALTAALLVSSFDAFETQGARVEADDER